MILRDDTWRKNQGNTLTTSDNRNEPSGAGLFDEGCIIGDLDLSRDGFQNVLEKTYPAAARDFIWQWFFPQKGLMLKPGTKEYRRYHLHESQAQEALKKGIDHTMSDERILGDSEFVESVPAQANEEYERRYELKLRGFDLERIAERVAELYGIGKEEVFSKGRQREKVKARSLLCYWAVREAGISLRTLAGRLGISGPGVGYAVERGAALVRENNYALMK